MSISVLRRYTPPTCTLEILAVQSPLSRWTDRPVLKNLKFQLRFDDPRLVAEDHAVIEGDRAQLDALYDSVSTYVQQMLDPEPLYAYAARDPEVPHSTGQTTPDAPDSTKLAFAAAPARSPVVALHPNALASTIFLRPRGLVSHELHLGDLASSQDNSVIVLSTLQLFDLSNALDSYAADVVALPDDVRPAWTLANQRWLKAAAVFLLAVGVSTSLFQVIGNYSNAPVNTASVDESADADIVVPQPPASELPPGPRAPRQIPQDLRPLPPSAFERSNAPGAENRQGQARPAQRRPRRTAGDRRPPRARPANPRQGVPRLPEFSPVPPQVASVPESSTGVPSEIPSQASGLPASGTMRSDPMQIESAPVAPSAAESGIAAVEPNATLSAPSTQSAPATTAFDAIPQVAELRRYVEGGWSPPEGVTQSLEYRLTVDANGSVQSVTPLGDASRIYQAQAGLPAPGQAIVSPLENAQRAVFRVVLNPEGQVQTFLESLN